VLAFAAVSLVASITASVALADKEKIRPKQPDLVLIGKVRVLIDLLLIGAARPTLPRRPSPTREGPRSPDSALARASRPRAVHEREHSA
jgi:hypothetical protein